MIVIAAALTVAAPAALVMSTADAACNSVGTGVASGATGALTGGTGQGGGGVSCDPTNGQTGVTSSLGSLANNIVTIFSYVVGAISIIMIIYGGLRYVTSGGDSNSVGGAKNTIIYAIIGLVIVALAQLIVHFVLNQTSNVNQNGVLLLRTTGLF